METHLPWYLLNPCIGRFWCKVFKQKRCRAPQEFLTIIISRNHRLDRIKKIGTCPDVRLHKRPSDAPQVPAQGTRKFTGRPPLLYQTNICTSNSTYKPWGYLPIPSPRTNRFGLEIVRYLPVLYTVHWPHHDSFPQGFGVNSGQSKLKHLQGCGMATKLWPLPLHGHHPIQGKWHGIANPRRWFVPLFHLCL